MTKGGNCNSDKPCGAKNCKDCIQNCCLEKCDSYTSEEIECQFKDAVVQVQAEFILLGTTGTAPVPLISATGGTPLGPNIRTDVILNGNGFFIKSHYIVTPAHLVLLPPSLTSVVNRFPIFDVTNTALGNIKNQMIRASRILVSVFNVNGKGHSFVYEADLVGVDGAGDIAVLKINHMREWNRVNPVIQKCHPRFEFGRSRAAIDGEKIYIIGDYVSNSLDLGMFNAAGAINEGLLSDHRYTDYSGYALAESLLISASAYSHSSGLPIINGQGEVIGMQTTDVVGAVPRFRFSNTPVGLSNGTGVIENGVVSGTGILNSQFLNQAISAGIVAGPSEFFMRNVIKKLIKADGCSKKLNCLNLELICDPAGTYYRYKKGYAGIAYQLFSGIDYDITTDYTSGSPVGGLPRIRLNINGEFLNSPSCKELVGVRVRGLAGINPDDAAGIANGRYFVPGGTGTVQPFIGLNLPISPFLGKLQPGDIITHIGKFALGDINKQIPPALLTWRLSAGDTIEICYRRGGNALNSSDNSLTENYDNLKSYIGCLVDYPYLMDYPWYTINRFPLLTDAGFTFPANQSSNPQIPQANLFAGAGIFFPAF